MLRARGSVLTVVSCWGISRFVSPPLLHGVSCGGGCGWVGGEVVWGSAGVLYIHYLFPFCLFLSMLSPALFTRDLSFSEVYSDYDVQCINI